MKNDVLKKLGTTFLNAVVMSAAMNVGSAAARWLMNGGAGKIRNFVCDKTQRIRYSRVERKAMKASTSD